MRKMIEIVVGELIDLLSFGIDVDKHQIERLWTVYDEEKMWDCNKFNPFTGAKIERGDLEALHLKHHEGVFIEDRVHDWQIRRDKTLDYYSRVVGKGSTISILLEYKDK
ncbi:hypothetical protein PP175_28905 (plasmid) [Aneurinibacillus sp. Ricciae_BoGa-3]|uniref:hypothetical protein n=1 Tax=Aneurinibacillus sp. Ricciae_BoGa-3 TaxID=3022697 RepID=UPI002341BD44|nr:hypothetical protein [Aneurinibacillus sp. Ricciae_BoGa-3]WCK57211.1 hypothetical protein PP175_28905 [Aneurinibacillus sp. Ricciae_BoGa-3]